MFSHHKTLLTLRLKFLVNVTSLVVALSNDTDFVLIVKVWQSFRAKMDSISMDSNNKKKHRKRCFACVLRDIAGFPSIKPRRNRSSSLETLFNPQQTQHGP